MTVKPLEATAPPPSAEAFAEAHRRLLSDSSIQFDFSNAPPREAPNWLRAIGDGFEAALPVLKVLFWIGVAIAALFLLYAIYLHLRGREWPWQMRRSAEEADWRPAEAPARELLAEADALAAGGHYSDAAHLLLFRSIEDIDRRRPDLVGPALTSRDIAALAQIPERPRGAFARIAALVERGLFARRALDGGDWRDCRAAYEEFAFADGWRG
jgi:hypothetical protein